jgi:hypothetical protein
MRKPLARNRVTYTPGGVHAKRVMILGGTLLLLLGVFELRIPLRIVFFGARTEAQMVRVIKEAPGVPPLALVDNDTLERQLEPRDRRFIFWNEFRWTTADGRIIEGRGNVGSQLKPLYPLTDPDGLPTTDLLCYDPRDPARAVLPLVISTWVTPGVLAIVGLLTVVTGAVLLRWARVPIELPRLADVEETNLSP